MTKSLKQIQEENRKFILEAIHCCSYEEALKKEEGRTCEYFYQTNYGVQIIIGDVKDYGYNRERHHPNAFLVEIIGKPITLGRLLLAFKNKDVKTCYEDEIIFNIAGSQFCGFKLEDEFHNSRYSLYGICLWNLELETLEEQSEETQTKINKLFTKDS